MRLDLLWKNYNLFFDSEDLQNIYKKKNTKGCYQAIIHSFRDHNIIGLTTWIGCSTPSKVLFLTYQMVHNTWCSNFQVSITQHFHCQHSNSWITIFSMTHETPKRVNTNYHNYAKENDLPTLNYSHMQHQSIILRDCYWIISTVKLLTLAAVHAKKAILLGTFTV